MTTAQVHNRNVLIVEDNPDSRDTLQLILEGEGYHVYAASNGREALERLRNAPLPCIILLDLMMPIMDGWEFRRHQNLDPNLAGIPTIVVSGVNDADHGVSVEATDYIRKPIDIPLLLDTVDVYC